MKNKGYAKLGGGGVGGKQGVFWEMCKWGIWRKVNPVERVTLLSQKGDLAMSRLCRPPLLGHNF